MIADRPELNMNNYDESDVANLEGWAIEAEAEIEKLNAFKKYVHDRLDAMKIPFDPYPGRTEQTGCRIGSRLNMVEQLLADGEYWDKHASE